MSTKRLFRLLAMMSAMVFGLMLPATKAFAEGSKYINADIENVKIGDLYYDLNTKTHKAAVVYQHDPSGVLTNYEDLTSVDIPSTIKFLNPANHYIEEEFAVVEIGTHAFANCPNLDHISIPSSIVYIGMDMVQYFESSSTGEAEYKHQYLEKNPSGYVSNGYYIDNCLVGTKTDIVYWEQMNLLTSRMDNYQGWIHKKLETLKVKAGTRIVAEKIINASNIYFPEGNIRLSGDILCSVYRDNVDAAYIIEQGRRVFKSAELFGTTLEGQLLAKKIYNYGGKLTYTNATYNLLEKMYVTRDVAPLFPASKWGDKVGRLRFVVDGIFYELLNKDEAVVVKDISYDNWYYGYAVTIPSTVQDNGHTFKVTKIDPNAFADTNLTSVTLPSTMKEVSQGAFSGCTKLEEVNFADEITTISMQAFMGCTSLKEIHLNQVANIASEAFKGCTSLATLITDYNGVINAHSLAFDGLNKGNITLQVASNMVDRYKADAVWKDFNIAANRHKVEGIWYELSGNNAMVVKEKSGEGNYSELTGKVTIPKDVVINGKYYTVTSLEKGAFQYAPFEELDIRCQVTILPEGCCFAMPNLTKVWLPETLVKIDVDAFNSCSALRYFNGLEAFRCADFPSLTTICESAFANSRLNTAYLNGSVTKVGEYAFFNCTHLQDLILGEKLTTIGKYAFSNCQIRRLHNYAAKPQPYTTGMFEGMSKYQLIRVPFNSLDAYRTADGWKEYRYYAQPCKNWLDDDRYLYFYPDNATLTATITSDDDASSETDNYKALGNTVLEIPREIESDGKTYTVVAIDEAALKYAPIKKLVLPATIKSIGDEAFSFSAIEEVDFDNISGHECKLGKYAFSHCVNLKEVWVSGYTPCISEGAFADCFALEKAVIPGGVQEIGKDAFSNCAKLEDLQLPSSLTTIGESAFWNCTSLGSLAIPEKVSTIGEQAFKGCTGIYEIYNLNNTPQTITANVFEGLTPSKINLYVPPTRKSAYEAKDVWKNFNVKESKAVVGGLCYMVNPVTRTAQLTFDELIPMPYAGLSGKVTVPASIIYNNVSYDVTEIGNYAFQGNTTITEIVLPEGIKTIGADCFERMTKLTKVNIPQTVESIFRFESSGNGITQNDNNYQNGLLIIDNCLLKAKKELTGQVDVPEGMRLVAGYAFCGCKEITRINLPETVTEVGPYAFETCKKLGEINLPKGLKVIYNGTFNSCETLGTSTLTLPESLQEIQHFSFWKTVRLTELRFPEGLRKIGDQAFWQSGLKRIWLPESIESLGAWAFADLTVLEEVHLAAPDPSAITLGDGVFDAAPAGAKLYVPYGSRALYQSAPQWSAFTIEEENPCIDGFYYVLDKVNQTATVTYEAVSDNWNSVLANYGKLNSQRWNIPAKVALEGIVYDVKGIGDKAFYQTNVAIVVLPEGLESIGDDAFADTYEHFVSLTAVVLPSTLTSIGEFAFYNQRNLKEIYNYATTPQDISGKGVFADGTYGTIDKSKIRLYVPYGCKAAYEADDEWKDFDIEEMSVCIDGVYYALDEENATASVTYQYFDDERNYADLRRDELIIPAVITVADKEYEVTSIGDGAFAHTKNIKLLVLSEGLKRIKGSAFGGSALTMVYLPSTLTEIDPWTFAYCENPVTIRNFATEPLAVADFKYFTKGVLEVPAGSKEAYEAADVWKDFTISEMDPCIDGIYYSIKTGNATVITDYTGHNYSLLGEEIEIPEMITVGERRYTVTHIINHAFSGNTMLKKLTLPAMLSAINFQAFSGCTSLREIVNHRTAPAVIDATVFDGLSKSACTLFVHRESVEAYKSADEWKDFNIVSIETPIMIAGQPIRSDMYGKPLTDIKGVWGVTVTASGIYLDGGGWIYTEDVPAIELYADGISNNFFIGGKDAHLYSTGSPAIRVSGNRPVTLNLNTHFDGDETTEGLDLRIDSDSDEGAIAFANGMESTLNINSLGGASTNATFIVANNAPIGIPPSAYCDIHAAGVVDLVSNSDVCPIGVFNTSKVTLHSTTMVLPFGGEIKEEGIFDAFGNDCFRLRLAPIYTQSGKAYPVELAGMTVTEGNKEDILGNGKASYEPLTNTLTLNDVNLTDTCGQVLHATAGLRLEVKGKNNLFSTSGRPSVEVQGGDFVIFGSKDSELDITGENGVQCDETEQYRMEVKRCSVGIYSWDGEFGLQADSLCVNAGNLAIGANGSAPAWRSWNTAEDGGLVLKHANKTYGNVNADVYMEFERQDPLLFKVEVAVDEEFHGTVAGGGWFEDGTEITLTATAKEGFKFVRWDDDVTDNPRLLTVDDDYTFTAIFAEQNQYIVTFLDFYGVAISYDYVYEGQAATAPEVPEVEGYTFTGWDQDFSNVTSDMTVTAQYTRNTYTVTFLGFGDEVLKTETVEYGEAATAPDDIPNVEHYVFMGWDQDFSYITSDLTVTAQYEPEKLNVTFYGFGGLFLKAEQVPYGGYATAPSVPSVEGYEFVGWMTPENEVLSSEEVNAAVVVTDITYTAVYESTAKIYSLKLEVEGNGKLYFGIYNAFGELQTVEATESVYNLPEGSQFILIAIADEGWAFVQWNDGLTKDRRNITLTSDLMLRAIFSDDPDGIRSVAGSASDEMGVKVVHKGKIYILRDGKVFTADGRAVSSKVLGR